MLNLLMRFEMSGSNPASILIRNGTFAQHSAVTNIKQQNATKTTVSWVKSLKVARFTPDILQSRLSIIRRRFSIPFSGKCHNFSIKRPYVEDKDKGGFDS